MTRSHACLSVPLHQTNNGDAHTDNLFGDSKKKKTPNRFPVLRYNMLQLHAAQRGKKKTKTKQKKGDNILRY
jgi:hypothetical protein